MLKQLECIHLFTATWFCFYFSSNASESRYKASWGKKESSPELAGGRHGDLRPYCHGSDTGELCPYGLDLPLFCPQEPLSLIGLPMLHGSWGRKLAAEKGLGAWLGLPLLLAMGLQSKS